MEKKLKALFERQKFERNPRLDKMLREAEEFLDAELDEEALSFVTAAGAPEPHTPQLPYTNLGDMN